jgi:hypothetical protein
MSGAVASEVRPGDTIGMRTGPVVVLRREETHGGVELLVRPQACRGGKGVGKASRSLWFWPGQAVEVSRGKASSEVCCWPGRVGRAEATRKAVAVRAAKQAARDGRCLRAPTPPAERGS